MPSAFAPSGTGSNVARRVLQAQALVLVTALLFVPFLGSLLVTEDPLERADALFVLAGSRASRWLEARDLFKEGYAPVVLLSDGHREEAERLALEQGAPLRSEGELAREALVALGVPAAQVVVLAGRPLSTADEASALREYGLDRRWRTVIVVTSKLHTRRAAFAMRRAVADTPIRIVMRATRYDDDDPARWWRRRGTARRVMYELPALVAYVLGLGG